MRTYQSQRSRFELLADLNRAQREHGTQSREWKNAYMRWYRATRPELRAADLQRLLTWKKWIAEADAELAAEFA